MTATLFPDDEPERRLAPWAKPVPRPDPLPDPARPVHGKAARAHPDTSHEAARLVRYRAGTQKAAVVAALEAHGPQNAAQVTSHLVGRWPHLSRNQVATRIGELAEDGWVEPLRDAQGHPVEAATTPGSHYRGVVYRLSDRAAEQLA